MGTKKTEEFTDEDIKTFLMTANEEQTSKFVAGSAMDPELAEHLDEFDIEGHSSVKKMVIVEHTEKDFDRLSEQIPTWGEFVQGKMTKRGVKKKGVL